MGASYKCVSWKRFTSYNEAANVLFDALEACGWRKVSEPSGIFSVSVDQIDFNLSVVTYQNHGLATGDFVVYLGPSPSDAQLFQHVQVFRVTVLSQNAFRLEDLETGAPVQLLPYATGSQWFQKGVHLYTYVPDKLVPKIYSVFVVVDDEAIYSYYHGFYYLGFMYKSDFLVKVLTGSPISFMNKTGSGVERRQCFYVAPTYFASVGYIFDSVFNKWELETNLLAGFFPNRFYRELTYVVNSISPTSIEVADVSGFVPGKSYKVISNEFFDRQWTVTIDSISGNVLHFSQQVPLVAKNNIIGVVPLSHYVISDFTINPPYIRYFLGTEQDRWVYPDNALCKVVIPTTVFGSTPSDLIQWLHPFYLVGEGYVYGVSDRYVYYCPYTSDASQKDCVAFVVGQVDNVQCGLGNTETILRVGNSRWQPNSLVGKVVAIVSGVGDYQVRRIVGNTSDYLVVDSPFDVIPAQGDWCVIGEQVFRKAGYLAFREGV